MSWNVVGQSSNVVKGSCVGGRFALLVGQHQHVTVSLNWVSVDASEPRGFAGDISSIWPQVSSYQRRR